jgi:hypothetical protein
MIGECMKHTAVPWDCKAAYGIMNNVHHNQLLLDSGKAREAENCIPAADVLILCAYRMKGETDKITTRINLF